MVTIARTQWQDDDGTGTTGTVINNAEKTLLYNQIDGALAQLLPLGGGTLTGGLSVVQFAATGTSPHTFAGPITVNGFLRTTGLFQAFDTVYRALTMDGSSVLIATSGTTRMQIDASGLVSIGGAAASAQVNIAASGTHVVNLQNMLGSSVNFINFLNNAAGIAGAVVQLSATTVQYVTTSDQRLKTDRGRATDLSALRAVEIHDFDWIPDGARDRGVFAQQAIRLFPRAVVEGTDETTPDGSLARPWMTDYSKFVADLIVGFQQHDVQLADLYAELAALKGSH